MPQLKTEESLKKGGGMDETQQRAQKLLFPGHTCRVALEVKKNKAGGSSRVLSVVSPAEGKSHSESCIFILGKTKLFSSSLQVVKMIPILSDFQASISDDNQFEISWLSKKRETRSFIASNAESMGVLLRTISKAHQIACNQRLDVSSVASGNSHGWLQSYKLDEDKAMEQILWLRSQPVVEHDYPQQQVSQTQSTSLSQDGGEGTLLASYPKRTATASTSSMDGHLLSPNFSFDSKPSFIGGKATTDPLVISFMTAQGRSDWVDGRLRLLQNRFVDRVPVTLRICSWNVAAKFPTSEEDLLGVREWLLPSGRDLPDIISIGLLETVKLTANALMVNEASPESKRWEDLIGAFFNVPFEYTMMLSRQYVGIYQILLVKRSLVEKDIVRCARSKCAGCGILGFGNKGAVSISVIVHSDTICFTCSHLAAGQSQVDRRNNDAEEIRRSTIFKPAVEQTQGLDRSGRQGSDANLAPRDVTDIKKQEEMVKEAVKLYSIAADNTPSLLEEHDFQFFFGDLNYRIDRAKADIIEALRDGHLEELQADDQLRKQMKAGRAFSGFQESPTDFFPTYKYDIGTDEFDTSDKARSPAWCDRILSRTRHGEGNLTQTRYERHSVHLSDHKPISATFTLKVKRTDKAKLAEVAAEVSRQLDIADNECIPSAMVDDNEVVFSEVEYRRPQTRVLTITNDGNITAYYRFIPKGHHRSHICKSWLHVRPKYGVLLPGESAELRITVIVDDKAARALARGERELEDVLILHVEGGNDTFISVTGSYLTSCYGSSIQSLLALTTPARYSENLASEVHNPHLPPIPKEVWRLCGAILDRGMDEEKIFFICGDEAEVGEVRNCLDTGTPFRSDIQLHSIAEALVQFLRALPEAVIPRKYFQKSIDTYRTEEECWTALESMPAEQFALLQYIIGFLRELLAHSAENKLTLHSLSLLMAAVLMESGWNAAEGQQVGNPLLVQGQHFLQILLGVPGVTSSIPDAQDDESASRDDAQVAGAKIV